MDPHVGLQVLTLTERFLASFRWALVWLSSKMQVHVGFQSNFPAKDLKTAYVRAWKSLAFLAVFRVLFLRAALALLRPLVTLLLLIWLTGEVVRKKLLFCFFL